MMGRSPNSEIQGFFCPLMPRRVLDLRLARGSCVFTHEGLEKKCPRCKAFWPLDTEFWFANKGTIDGVFQWCRACYHEHRWPKGRTSAALAAEAETELVEAP